MRSRRVPRALAVLVAPVAVLTVAAPALAQTDPIGGLAHQVTAAVNQVLSDVEGIPPVEDGVVRGPLAPVVPVAGAPLKPFIAALLGGNFYCHTHSDGTLTVPGGVNAVQIVAAGGQGGDPSLTGRAAGGQGGIVTATYFVQPGQTLHVAAACGGNGGGGLGGGGGGWQGRGNMLWLDDGAGGGGASTVIVDARLLVVAGGGGGGGGSTALNAVSGGQGGTGGSGGPGANGGYAPDGSSPGVGGCGACSEGLTGVWGARGSGGGGGGGGGFPGGGGGTGGVGTAGGGGGGGGASYADPWAPGGVAFQHGAQAGDGYVIITFGTI